ncbi:MAG: hypothetical protein ABGW77_04540 [Campylobacterales bacterium]
MRFIVGIGIGAVLLFGWWGNPWHRRGHHLCWRRPESRPALNLPLFQLLGRLELNPSQQAKIRGIITKYREQQLQLPTHSQIFLEAIEGGEFNATLYFQKRLVVAQRRITFQTQLLHRILKVLTPLQRQKLIQILKHEGGVNGLRTETN